MRPQPPCLTSTLGLASTIRGRPGRPMTRTTTRPGTGTVSACFGVAALHRTSLGRAVTAVLLAVMAQILLWLGLLLLALATVRI
jgi:TM2 domain-containing membrane protein YozV